ncbi:hypothetical protein SAMN04490357_4966 [Streptomyces misionensis]|uniref:Uncharacterized protein n=1 Tax=Streptomyces misionensis TaxID=67331 RepID=A0A1H5B5A9_9ACTN|nr:hypothetical protein [Streptomyces misionensis]SED49516.1 hypothetical protein SAMN04490357_4966 [Streptomyces misionensis]
MCISTGEAVFSGTVLYCGRRRHPEHGLVHVLGYQNTVANLADGPNAMLLHLPTRRLVPEQFVSVGRHGDVLRRMVDAVAAPPVEADGMAAMDWLGAEPEPVVRVFEHDVYTVLLADDPTLIHTALHRVPWKRRPRIEPELLVFYAEHFPDHAIALCCFDNADARQAKPLLVWYHPNDPDQLTVPALDSHTGGAPDLDARVAVDHWVLFSSDEAGDEWGTAVEYPERMRHQLSEFLPDRVVGRYYGDDQPTLANGDFGIEHRHLLADDLDRVERRRPVTRT